MSENYDKCPCCGGKVWGNNYGWQCLESGCDWWRYNQQTLDGFRATMLPEPAPKKGWSAANWDELDWSIVAVAASLAGLIGIAWLVK